MPRKPKKRKRRASTTHRGVFLVRRVYPSGNIAWRAKWTEPGTGKVQWETLDPRLDTDALRTAWAERKLDEIRDRRAALRSGTPIPVEAPLEEVLDLFIEAKRPELRERSIVSYQAVIDILKGWSADHGIAKNTDLTAPVLANFRPWLAALPKRRASSGGKRGEAVPTGKPRSAATVNKDLRSLRCVLNELRRLGHLPHLDSDAIKDSLRGVKAQRPLPTFLRTRDLRKLLEAALRHDEAVYSETRAEHRGEGEKGSTRRYEPVAAFVSTVLLTGARFGEIAGLRWGQVDLEASEILLAPEDTKTGHGRRIPLDVTPGLHALLRRLSLQTGDRGSFVFGPDGNKPLSANAAKAAVRRLVSHFGAPSFSWQMLRRTCGTFLTCAPGVYGAASAFMSAKRLGHGVQVAEKFYVDALSGIDPAASTIEAAMGVEDLIAGFASGEQTSAGRARTG